MEYIDCLQIRPVNISIALATCSVRIVIVTSLPSGLAYSHILNIFMFWYAVPSIILLALLNASFGF